MNMNETTPLTATAPGPSCSPLYPARMRDRQIKRFQCCICASLLAAFLTSLAITISFLLTKEGGDIVPESSTEFLIVNTSVEIPDGFLLLQLPIPDEQLFNWTMPEITELIRQDAIQAGKKALGDKEILEESISSPGLNSPTFRHQRAVSTSKEARIASKRGYVENKATCDIIRRLGKKPKYGNVGKGPLLDLGHKQYLNKCEFNHKYRTANGTCNNLINPHSYGVAMIPFRRALQAEYEDGVSEPRASVNGRELPSARKISIEVHRPSYNSDPNFTVMLAVFGQFLDHDITATALNQGIDGVPIECCDSSQPKHPECFPVPLGAGDPYFDVYNMTCMNFVRSVPAPTGRFGPREQLNQATAYIDGSVVYGSSESRMMSLRTGQEGKLRMFQTPDNRTLLPVTKDPEDGCNEQEMNAKGKYCFESGDARANENLHLTSMHLLWARHHNYLADQLLKLNPHWNDEKVFQEARKILGAQLQHITFNEFLPILLGVEVCERMGIISEPNEEKDVYNSTVEVSIANNFAAAAFRFAHTLLPTLFKLTKNTNTTAGIALHTMLFNPYSLYGDKGLDEALKTAMNTPIEKSDRFFSTEITEKLFQQTEPKVGKPCGLDLVSLNIQRGRDHGLPSYPKWRKHCHLSPVDTWEEMASAVDPDSLQRMKNIYRNPENIDIYTGALSEFPVHGGGIVGPLLACLIGDQMVRLKIGDSYWYERNEGPQKFSKEQLREIYKTKLSSIICRNSDKVNEAPIYVMQHAYKNNNDVVDCKTLDVMDYQPWQESHTHEHFVKMNSQQSNVKEKRNSL